MKNLITTLRNIWSIKELRDKLIFTVAMLAIYRLGSYILLPGVRAGALETGNNSGTDLLGLINNFTGGAFSSASIFALGIMPYITASIIIQLLGFAVPYFQRLQQREGESGRKKINQIMRMLTVAITLVQGGAYLTFLFTKNAVSENIDKGLFWFVGMIVLATGTMFAMWLGERINDKGIGNGTSMIIMTGIMSRLPAAFLGEFQAKLDRASGGLVAFVLEMVFLVAVVMFTILLVQGVRRIPVQFAKRMVGRDTASMPAAGNRDYIPLKLNTAGVMPIIFAQALMFLPATIVGFVTNNDSGATLSPFLRSLQDYTSPTYNLIYFVLVLIFTYVYTALVVNPQQYAEYLQRQNAFIPGVKPGESTEEFIDHVTTRITFPGGVFIGLIAILPAFARMFGINNAFAAFFGGTSLLIFVGVILDTLQQIESHLLMQKYDGLVKSGKIEGRAQSGLQQIGGFQ
jgi:preprotein translocase subunit SecY